MLGDILPLKFYHLVCLQLGLFSLSCYDCLLPIGSLLGMSCLFILMMVYLVPVIELAREKRTCHLWP